LEKGRRLGTRRSSRRRARRARAAEPVAVQTPRWPVAATLAPAASRAAASARGPAPPAAVAKELSLQGPPERGEDDGEGTDRVCRPARVENLGLFGRRCNPGLCLQPRLGLFCVLRIAGARLCRGALGLFGRQCGLCEPRREGFDFPCGLGELLGRGALDEAQRLVVVLRHAVAVCITFAEVEECGC